MHWRLGSTSGPAEEFSSPPESGAEVPADPAVVVVVQAVVVTQAAWNTKNRSLGVMPGHRGRLDAVQMVSEGADVLLEVTEPRPCPVLVVGTPRQVRPGRGGGLAIDRSGAEG
jgi:hypothetical protein